MSQNQSTLRGHELQVIHNVAKRFEEGENTFQLEFFFDDSVDQRYTNTFTLYDAVPMFTYGKGKELAQTVTADEMTKEIEFDYNKQTYRMQVTAGTIQRREKDAKGKVRRRNVMIFPGKREEMVQNALFKLAANNTKAIQTEDDKGRKVYGVAFSLYGLQQELKQFNLTYSVTEIREAIEVLNSVKLQISRTDGKTEQVLNESPLPLAHFRSRFGDTDCDPHEQEVSYVRFNTLVNHSIEQLTSRQFQYPPIMLGRYAMTRYLVKRMADRFTNAEVERPYIIHLSTLFRNTGSTWDENKVHNNKRRAKATGDELIELGVAAKYALEPIKRGRKVEDFKFVIYLTPQIVKDTVRANRRKAEAKIYRMDRSHASIR